MYLLGIYFKNARKNGDGRFCFKKDRQKIRKWTQFPAGMSNLELLQLMAVACAGDSFLRELPYALGRLCRNPDIPLQLEFILSTEYIDELIGIVFRQNMKSMEKYYRWLSKRYVQAFGKLHNGLVDTIFKYNNRDSKGRYITTMAGTRGKRKPDPYTLYFIGGLCSKNG